MAKLKPKTKKRIKTTLIIIGILLLLLLLLKGCEKTEPTLNGTSTSGGGNNDDCLFCFPFMPAAWNDFWNDFTWKFPGLADEPETQECNLIDTDGNNKFETGKCYDMNGVYTDYCKDDNTVIEYVIEGGSCGKCTAHQTPCDEGDVCSAGRCVPDQTQGVLDCADSCALIDGYTSGFCTSGDTQYGAYTFNDLCSLAGSTLYNENGACGIGLICCCDTFV